MPVIVKAAKGSTTITVLDLDPVRHSRAELPDAGDTLIPWVGHPRSITITDLGVGEGELYLAGLSNEGFQSALRRVPPGGDPRVALGVNRVGRASGAKADRSHRMIW